MRVLLATLVAALIAPGVAAAQTKVPPQWLGTWNSLGLNPAASPLGAPPTELPYEVIDKKIADFVEPWALAEHDALEWNTDDTGQVCKLDGIFRQGHGTGAGNFRLVQAPGNKLWQIWSSVDEHGLARIYLDSPHPRDIPPSWNGDARGHFEGDDTFVVDLVGFNDKSWLGSDRWAHSEELHVVERYRMYGDGAFIQLRVFVDDRRTLKTPYTYTRYYRKITEPTEGGEAVCNENAPEDDLWAQRRNKLLDAHDAAFGAFMKKYDNEPLPKGPNPNPPKAAPPTTTSTADAAKLKSLAGVYEPVSAGAALPGGLKASGPLNDLTLVASAQRTAKSRNLDFDPAKHCIVVGPFRMMARPDARFEFITTPDRVTMMFENIALGNKREFYLGRKEHTTKGEGNYLGDSIARFEGDTLVVDTMHFNEMTWLNDLGAPHSDALHLVERIRPLAGGKYLEYQVTADDPKALTKPYTYTRYYQRSNTELQEDFCEDRK
jgi:hypothetical protein